MGWPVVVLSLSCVPMDHNFATPWTIVHQTSEHDRMGSQQYLASTRFNTAKCMDVETKT